MQTFFRLLVRDFSVGLEIQQILMMFVSMRIARVNSDRQGALLGLEELKWTAYGGRNARVPYNGWICND
jgi:hypothetical protein